MQGSLPAIERFKVARTSSDRSGVRAYVTPVSISEFLAYGIHEPSGRVVFAVVGSLKHELHVFRKQMESEGVKVVACYGPKVAADNFGKIVPSCAALADALNSPPIEDQINDPPPPPLP